MAFIVVCSSCKSTLRLPVQPTRAVDCPKCHAVIPAWFAKPEAPQAKAPPVADPTPPQPAPAPPSAPMAEPQPRPAKRRDSWDDVPMPVVIVQPRIVPRIFAAIRIIVWVIALGLIVVDYTTAMRLVTNNVQYIQFIGNMIFVYCCARAIDFILRYASESI